MSSAPADFNSRQRASCLGLGCGEVGCVVKAKLLPLGCVIGFIPSGGAWRTDEDALECADHGVSVETRLG